MNILVSQSREFIDLLSDCQPLKKDRVPRGPTYIGTWTVGFGTALDKQAVIWIETACVIWLLWLRLRTLQVKLVWRGPHPKPHRRWSKVRPWTSCLARTGPPPFILIRRQIHNKCFEVCSEELYL